MVFNNKIYDQIKSGNFDQDQGEIREKSGNFILHSEWEPWLSCGVLNGDEAKILKRHKLLIYVKKTSKTDLIFILGDVTLKVVSSYTYLGMVFHEHIDYNAFVDILTSSASRALGSVIAKFKTFKDVGFDTLISLQQSSISRSSRRSALDYTKA